MNTRNSLAYASGYQKAQLQNVGTGIFPRLSARAPRLFDKLNLDLSEYSNDR